VTCRVPVADHILHAGAGEFFKAKCTECGPHAAAAPVRLHLLPIGLYFHKAVQQYLIQLRVSGVMVDVNFLVATILVVIALLFYILHWNRVLAFFIGLAFRVVLWNKGGSSAWIQIGAQPLAVPLILFDAPYRLFSSLTSGGSRSAQGFLLPFK
jgi:hypothetical protein